MSAAASSPPPSSGRPRWWPAPGEDGDSGDSLLLAGLRSALCAPIVSDGEVVACLYVTHHQVGDLFGDLEIQLAEFVATVAGAALEHVAGSEARFRSLAHNSSDVITIVDADGRVTYQSASVSGSSATDRRRSSAGTCGPGSTSITPPPCWRCSIRPRPKGRAPGW